MEKFFKVPAERFPKVNTDALNEGIADSSQIANSKETSRFMNGFGCLSIKILTEPAARGAAAV